MRFINFPEKFWIVSYPLKSDDSIKDIIIKTDVKNFFEIVSRGELTFDEIYGIYGTGEQSKAQKDAQALLRQLESGEIEPYGSKHE